LPKTTPGTIAWHDLTVPDAARVRDFYRAVVGWKPQAHAMGKYSDWSMLDPVSGKAVAGVCWKRGPNRKIPSQWLIYITVKNLKRSLAACRRKGGKVIDGPKNLGAYGDLAIIRDPGGAVAALIQPPAPGR